MVINPITADTFIKEYSLFLHSAAQACGCPEDLAFLEILAFGRDAYLSDKTMLEEFKESYEKMPDWVYESISKLQVSNWVYLKDTKKYSLFIEANESAAYAVQGLTDSIKDILGGASVYVKTGIFPLGDKFVCDGIITSVAHLGDNIRMSYNNAYQGLKNNGKFHKKPQA